MTTLLVTGTSGHLGRLVVEELLARGVPAGQVVATARDTAAVQDLADRGVVVRHADYDDPESLRTALAGVDRVLLVSASEPGKRVPQHRNVIEAAAAQGVSTLAYTSIVNASTSSLALAQEHVETERLLAASGLPVVLLRNSWYLESWTAQLAGTVERGVLVGAAGGGRVSAATRADFAAAAAAVLADDATTSGTYELGGDTAFTLAELAADIATATGREVVYQDLPQDAYTDVLVQAGLPRPFAEVLADSDRGLAAGDLRTDSGDLSRLGGRPTTTALEAVRAAYADQLATR
jgi:NAD(P)H dehydrogenase (quinone)